jgi:hypothetical protein
MRAILLALVVLLIYGCESAPVFSGKPFSYENTNSTSDAVLYVYRPGKKISSCCWPSIKFGYTPVVNLPNGSYTKVLVEPGVHRISFDYQRGSLENPKPASQKFNKTLELAFEPGKEYYLKFDIVSEKEVAISHTGSSPVVYSENQLVDILLKVVPKDVALSELKGTQQVLSKVEKVNL